MSGSGVICGRVDYADHPSGGGVKTVTALLASYLALTFFLKNVQL